MNSLTYQFLLAISLVITIYVAAMWKHCNSELEKESSKIEALRTKLRYYETEQYKQNDEILDLKVQVSNLESELRLKNSLLQNKEVKE